ncbi:MAG: twin-arginine translocase TatA/TatE family subunit [Eubacteriales bacterium]|nr:twin-arginine translocase TatA/TatE family subunit [Eubacteriales bacterium]
MKIGLQELVVIFIVALIVLGPDKLPYYAQKLGQAMKQFKKYTAEATKDIRENIVEPLEEAKRPLKEAMEPINDLNKEINKNVNGIKKPFADLGKPAETCNAEKSEKMQEEQKEASEEESENPVSDAEVQGMKETVKIYQEEC